MRPSLVSVLFATLVACSKAPEPLTTVEAGRPPTPPAVTEVTIIPEDLLSDLGATPLKIVLGNQGDATVKAVAEQLLLRSYPELSPVPFSTNVQFARVGEVITWDAGAKGTQTGRLPDTVAEVTVIPGAKLDEGRWYVLSITSLPQDARIPTFADRPNLGARYSRFRYGSGPVLRSVTLGSNDGDVYPRFSERLSVDEKSVALLLGVQSGGQDCTFVPNTSSPPLPATTLGLRYKCPPVSGTSTTLRISVKPGLKGIGGTEFGVLRPNATTSVDLVQVGAATQDIILKEGCGTGCLGWVP